MIKIGMNDIEKLLLLADDVLKNLMHSYWSYGDEGNDLFENYETHGYSTIKTLIDKQKESENCYLLMRIIRDETLSLRDVLDLQATDILEKLNDEIIRKALGIFKRGTIQDTVHNDTNFYVDKEVDDDYLKNLFAMRIRDLMIVHAAQRGEKSYYLLTYTHPHCHDGDEWIAITDSLSQLRKYYEAELKNPLRLEYFSGLKLTIYEFDGFKKYTTVTPERLWGISYND